MIGFFFHELIERAGIAPKTCRLVRHDRRIAGFYHSNRGLYLHHVSYQAAGSDPYNRASYAFQFLPGPVLVDGDQTALFIGAHKIVERWDYDETRLSPYHYPGEDYSDNNRPHSTYDLQTVDAFEHLAECVLIRWGASAKSWSQWADRRPKEILEIKSERATKPFPGFMEFQTTFDDVAFLPPEWAAILQNAQGVYLLTHPKTGEQYVGSAYGEGGFWGRWQSYAANGHGGNKLLRPKVGTNFQIAILEVTSSAMTPAEIIGRENLWKRKLGSRAHGLNGN